MNDRSRKYTNIILTVIAILLAIIAFKPSSTILPTAEAQNQLIPKEQRNEQQTVAFGDTYKEAAGMIADALNNIANSNSNIAASLDRMGSEIRTIGSKVDRMSTAIESNQNKTQ